MTIMAKLQVEQGGDGRSTPYGTISSHGISYVIVMASKYTSYSCLGCVIK
jgi:hypothetical protein